MNMYIQQKYYKYYEPLCLYLIYWNAMDFTQQDCYSKRPLYFIPAINGWNAEVGSRETKFPHLLTPKG